MSAEGEHHTIRKNYVLWRWITAVAICVVVAAIPTMIWASIANKTAVQTAAFVLCFVSVLTIVIILLGVSAFSFDYSLLGRLERSPPPPGFVSRYQTLSFGRIGIVNFSWPLVEWRVGKEGLVIKMLIGSGFIPSASITHVSRGAWMYDVLEHNCPEVASPVFLPKDVSEAARNILDSIIANQVRRQSTDK